MRHISLAFTLICIAALLPGKQIHADPAKDQNSAQGEAFKKFQSLAGDWTSGAGTVRFKVTSGGTAVQEIYFPDSKSEMVNMITRDGDKISLVHYCMIGNQPHMVAADKVDGNSVAFKFVDAGNMKSDKDMHMHSVTFIFVDANTVKERWISFKDGKPTGEPDEFIHKRKKQI